MSSGVTISKRTSTTAMVILAATMFVTGFTGFVFECILSTVATYVLGNSVEQFSITIGLMLACMGLGSFAQQYVKARRPVLPFVGVELLLVTVGGFAPVAMYAAFGFFEHHFQLIQYAIAGAIGFLIGSEIPFATRINEDFRGVALPSNLGSIFLWDYLGGFIGAIIFTKFLMPRMPLTEMSFLLGAAMLLIALLNYVYFMDAKRLAHYGVFLIVAAALAYGYSQNRRWNVALEQRLYADRIIYATTTPYQRIVLQHNETKNEYRLTLNGGLQFSSLDEARYRECHTGRSRSGDDDLRGDEPGDDGVESSLVRGRAGRRRTIRRDRRRAAASGDRRRAASAREAPAACRDPGRRGQRHQHRRRQVPA